MSAGRILSGRCAPAYMGMSALLILCGCSSGPSAADIQEALQASWDLLFGPHVATVESISDVRCKELQDEPGYACAFRVASFSKLTNAHTSLVTEGRFVEDGSKWVLVGK
jgi:hypothetical protein